MINNIIFVFVLFLINLVLFRILTKIFLKLKIVDEPDYSRKIHSSAIPLAGGAIFLINIFFYLITITQMNSNSFFNGSREILAFFLGAIFIYMVGLYDDRYSLKPNTKLILTSLIVVTSISISKSFQLNSVSFLFNEKTFLLENFGIIFTVFCYLVFLNAFNMMDGINGLGVSYFLICLIYIIILNPNFQFYLFLIIPAAIFLYFNFNNKVFLGDGGSLLLGFVLSSLFVKSYNMGLIFADQIVLLMIIPGIDMLRVAIIRILNKKHPFTADQSHLHHLILKNYSSKLAYILIISFISITALISKFVDSIFINLYQILIILVIYFFCINLIRSK